MSLDVRFKGSSNTFKDNCNPVLLSQEQLLESRKLITTSATTTTAPTSSLGVDDDEYLISTFYDIVSTIRDPEYNNTLEELKIVSPDRLALRSRL
jgi:predicted solute-binding protein